MSRVEVYFNLHKKLFSVRQGGRVLFHTPCILIHGPRFVVQEGGRQRVIREGRKNVHAFVTAPDMGDVASFPLAFPPEHHELYRHGWSHQVWYNPHVSGYFRTAPVVGESDPSPIHDAKWAFMWVRYDVPYILVKTSNNQQPTTN
jgi:hypothetical protein